MIPYLMSTMKSINVKESSDSDSEESSDSDNEKSSESSSDEELEDSSFKDYLELDETKQIYGDKRTIYKCSPKYLVEAIKSDEINFPESNRMVDQSRLETFKDFDKNKCDPIILAERLDKNSIFDIIDGQHRLTYLKNLDLLSYEDKNKIMSDYIPVDVRLCYSEDDFKEFIDSTNNRKNFSSDQLRVYKYPLLRELLQKEFKKNLFTAPYIKIEEDFFKIKLFKTFFFEDFNNTPDFILNKIKKINIFFSNLDDKSKLSTERNMTKKTYLRDRDRAEKLNMFLGLDKKLKWMDLLDINESEWNDKWNSFFIKKIKIKK